LTGPAGGSANSIGLFLVDSSGKITTVVRIGQSVAGHAIPYIKPDDFFTRPNPGGAIGFNDEGDITFLTSNNSSTTDGLGEVIWTRSRVKPQLTVSGNTITVPLTLIADSTNY